VPRAGVLAVLAADLGETADPALGVDLAQLPPEVRIREVCLSEKWVVLGATVNHDACIGAKVMLSLDVLRVGGSV
jgi:hypothetical protein